MSAAVKTWVILVTSIVSQFQQQLLNLVQETEQRYFLNCKIDNIYQTCTIGSLHNSHMDPPSPYFRKPISSLSTVDPRNRPLLVTRFFLYCLCRSWEQIQNLIHPSLPRFTLHSLTPHSHKFPSIAHRPCSLSPTTRDSRRYGSHHRTARSLLRHCRLHDGRSCTEYFSILFKICYDAPIGWHIEFID